MPAERTQQLVRTEFHPGFYTVKVQKILHPYRPGSQRRNIVDPRDHAALLAWPLIAVEIVSRATSRSPIERKGRKRFWEAYDEDEFLIARLFAELTDYNHNWPDHWKKERLLTEALQSPEFKHHTPPWADVQDYVESLFESLGKPPAYYKRSYAEHLREINQRRREILQEWQESIKAKLELEKAGICIPPLELRIAN